LSEVILSPLEKVRALEREIEKLPQIDSKVRHFFAPGLYAREMTIPAGAVLTGAVHKTRHLCTVSKGHIIVNDGTGPKELFEGMTFESPAGAKRAGWAIKTTVFTTYHATNTTDLDALAEELFDTPNDQLLGGANNRQALNQPRIEYAHTAADRADYEAFLAEYGLTEAFVRRTSEYEIDLVLVEFDTMQMRASPIEGNGLFAKRDLVIGEDLGPARIGCFRTQAGRFINHSGNANVAFKQDGDGLSTIALRNINTGEELTVDYRQACAVNGAGFAPIQIEGITK
jgi:hypothetical protein